MAEPAINASTIVDLGARGGLVRYRDDRLGLLGDLAARQCDLASSRLGPVRLLIVTSAEHAHDVLLAHAGDYVKSRGLSKFARPLIGNGLLSAEGEVHRKHRKLLAPGFQSRRIARYAADMIALTQAMLDRWAAGEERDFAHEITMLTVRIAAKTTFGDIDVPAEDVGAALEIANRWVMTSASSMLPVPLGIPTPKNQAMKRALATLDDIVYRVIERKRARLGDGAGDADILSMLLAAQDDETRGLTDQEIRDEVMTFFLAGHETTATALSWMFHALANHPGIHARLVDELDRVLAGRAPAFEDLERLTYLRHVTEETMRLYPPAYMIGRRARVATTVGGHPVIEGSYVLVNVFGIQRRADYFPDPLAFRPERFDAADPQRGTYLPFGHGPRVCIGNQFAMMEAGLLAATIFARALPAATTNKVALEPLITLRPDPGLPFRVTWRS